MAVSVFEMEIDSIKKKEVDDQQTIDGKFNELTRLYRASGSVFTVVMKKTQLKKIMLSLYSGCINTTIKLKSRLP